jgi:hypothetical protein
MAVFRVAVTDSVFPNLDTERAIPAAYRGPVSLDHARYHLHRITCPQSPTHFATPFEPGESHHEDRPL